MGLVLMLKKGRVDYDVFVFMLYVLGIMWIGMLITTFILLEMAN